VIKFNLNLKCVYIYLYIMLLNVNQCKVFYTYISERLDDNVTDFYFEEKNHPEKEALYSTCECCGS